MERRFPLHNNPYIATNPYLHDVGRSYSSRSKGCGSGGARSSSSWVLWEPRGEAPETGPWCSLLTILVLFLVILGVFAVAGLALYMGALRLEPVQFHLIFDGSMRVVGDRYSFNLSNKSSSTYQDKSRRYQTLLNAVYNKSILGPSVHDIFVNSFANGSLIVFFRIILDRKKIPKPISSIEETLKNVVLQEASSPLSVLNALRIDLKDFHIKRYLVDPRQHSVKDELTTVIAPIEQPKREYSGIVETPRPFSNVSHWPAVTSAATRGKTSPGQTIQSSSVAQNNERKVKKNNQTQGEATIVTPTLAVPNRQTTKPTVRTTGLSEPYLGVNYNSKRFDHFGTTSEVPDPAPVTSAPEMIKKEVVPPRPTTKVITAETSTTTASNLHYSDEPWKPIIPDEVRTLADKVDFDYGVGEAEVILDTLAGDISADAKVTTSPRMKIRPFRIAGVVEEVKMTPPPFEFKTSHAYTEKVDKPIAITSINEQKSMPELSILQQFHDLDSLLRSYANKQNTKPPTARPVTADTHPMVKELSNVVTLLPVRSNVGIREALRPRPKDDLLSSSTSTVTETIPATVPTGTSSTSESYASVNEVYSTTTETLETLAPRSNVTHDIFLSADSDMVAIPLQKYFSLTSPAFKAEGTNSQTTPKFLSVSQKLATENGNDIAHVTEGLRGIAIVGTDNMDVSSQRNIKLDFSERDRDPAYTRHPKMEMENGGSHDRVARGAELDQEMRLLLEEIFYNLTTTARSVYGQNRTNVRRTPQTIDFNYPASVQSQSFNMNNTEVLNKLAKLKIASHLDDRNSSLEKYSSHHKGSNKNVLSSFPSNGAPFRILTKVYNKAPARLEPKNTTEPTLVETSGCADNSSILCGSGECLPKHLRCNKLMECRDGSDETNCTCADFLSNRFNQNKICDGIYDCWDLSDEQNCEWCSPGQHICSNSKMCVDSFQVCDGFPHCPYGDDEKNCVNISPSVEEAAEKHYFPQGYVMVRKEGEWGKMCFQNFDNVISQSKTDWSIEDLGQSVCKTLTYRRFEGIIRRKDVIEHKNNSVTPASGRSVAPVQREPSSPPVYFELALSSESNNTGSFGNRRAASKDKFLFQKTSCVEKDVAEIKCSGLGCGIRPEANIPWTNERRSRIVGGGNAGPGAWPWQAALYKEGEFQCGATLISDVWLMSAGHCFYNAQRDYWVARLGALRRGTPPAPYEQLRPISQIILHPDYLDQGFINDISLLRMVRPISLTTYVRPICLPPSAREPKDGSMCTVVGWGQLHEVARVFPDTLQEVQLPVISTSECRKRTVFLPLYKVTDNMFCAGYERGGRDACLGDSGGPFMCQENDGSWTLAGVTSNGYGCARANRPGVYTKVVNYLPWAHEVMKTPEPKGPNYGPPACQGHRCPLGECLPPARLCNGYIECRDSSDERGCW